MQHKNDHLKPNESERESKMYKSVLQKSIQNKWEL